MSLTTQDEADLAALASGLGDSASLARAHNLVATNPEAAEVYRQLTVICDALQTDADRELFPLSEEEATQLATALTSKGEGRRAQQRSMLRPGWRWGVFAAVVGISCVTWYALRQPAHPVVAEAVFIASKGRLSPVSSLEPRRMQVRAGQLIETGAEDAVLTLASTNRIVATVATIFVVLDGSPAVELREGALAVSSTTPVEVRVGNTRINLEGARVLAGIHTTAEGPVCAVYSGQAKITRQGRETCVVAGRLATWSDTASDVHTDELLSGPPPWVKMALDAAPRARSE